jgi:hypothetical protein
VLPPSPFHHLPGAGRSLARAVPHGQEQGYADVRGTGQTIHRAKVFGVWCMLETRSRLRTAMAALRLSCPRFAYITSYLTRIELSSDRRRLRLHLHYILPPPLCYCYSLSTLETKLLD